MKSKFKLNYFVGSSLVIPRGLKSTLLKYGFKYSSYYSVYGTNYNCLVITFNNQFKGYRKIEQLHLLICNTFKILQDELIYQIQD